MYYPILPQITIYIPYHLFSQLLISQLLHIGDGLALGWFECAGSFHQPAGTRARDLKITALHTVSHGVFDLVALTCLTS